MSDANPRPENNANEGETRKASPSPSLHDTAPLHVTATFLPTKETGGRRERLIPVGVYPMGLSRKALRRASFITLFALASLWFLAQVQAVLPPFLIAFLIAALFDPTLRKLESMGRSRIWNVALIYLLGILAIALIIITVVPQATHQLQAVSENFSSYYSNIQTGTDNFLKQNAPLLKRLNIRQSKVSEFFNEQSSPVRDGIKNFVGSLGGVAQGLFSRAYWLIIIPIATFFLMLDYPRLRARFISLFPEEYQPNADKLSSDIVDVFSDYIRGLMKICILFGVCAFFIYSLLGVRYALALGMLAGIFYAIPYIGQLGSSIIVAMVSYSMPPHTALLFWNVPANSIPFAITVVICTLGLGVIFDQIVYARVVGGSVGLHPVVSMFALTAGATLFSLPGMLLAVPVAASIQVVLKVAFPRLKEEPRYIPAERNAPQTE